VNALRNYNGNLPIAEKFRPAKTKHDPFLLSFRAQSALPANRASFHFLANLFLAHLRCSLYNQTPRATRPFKPSWVMRLQVIPAEK
jgi:hypothetical protein